MKLFSAIVLGASLLSAPAFAQASGQGQGDSQPNRATMAPGSNAGTPSPSTNAAQQQFNRSMPSGQDAGDSQGNNATMPRAGSSAVQPGMSTPAQNQATSKQDNSGAK